MSSVRFAPAERFFNHYASFFMHSRYPGKVNVLKNFFIELRSGGYMQKYSSVHLGRGKTRNKILELDKIFFLLKVTFKILEVPQKLIKLGVINLSPFGNTFFGKYAKVFIAHVSAGKSNDGKFVRQFVLLKEKIEGFSK